MSEPGVGSGAMLMAGTLILLAGVLAFFARRQRASGGVLKVIESVNLGPRRSLVVAQLGAETLLLGCSEAGVCLLTSQSKPDVAVQQTAVPPMPLPTPANERGQHLAWANGATGTPERAKAEPAAKAHPGPSTFLELFTDSLEDEELRHKLAARALGRAQ